VKPKVPKSSTTETVTTGRAPHLAPALTLAATPATIASLAVAHVTMRADMPTPVLIAAIFLSILLPKIRRTVIAILCLLYGLAFLLIGVVRPNRHGDNLMQGLAKITSTLTGDLLPDWASAQAPTVSIAELIRANIPAPSVLPAAKPVPAAVPETKNGLRSSPAERADILPVVHDAHGEREPLYDVTFTNLAGRRPNGPSDVVDIKSSVADTLPDLLLDRRRPKGRHAKAKPEFVADELLSTA
jgi:hypothetical protein